MNERKCLGAFTPIEHPYPPYISINREEDGSVSVTVRSSSKMSSVTGFHEEGNTAIICIDESVLKKLLLDVLDPKGRAEMTLAEQRERLETLLDHRIHTALCGADILAAISAAGFSVVGPEVTEEMLQESRKLTWSGGGNAAHFKTMLAAGDLARKPE